MLQVLLMCVVVVCMAVGVSLNLGLHGSIGSGCSVYVHTPSTPVVVQSSSEYTTKTLTKFVIDGSVTAWINPSWRIPSVDIVDARGEHIFVPGKIVHNYEDDQYNIDGS